MNDHEFTQDLYQRACDLEKEFLFDEAIELLEQLFEHIKAINKKEGLPEKSSVMFPLAKIGSISLKIGTGYAIAFWERIRNYPYYEQESGNGSYKHIVDKGLANALNKQSKGYVYKPREMQDHFFDVMRSKGWR